MKTLLKFYTSNPGYLKWGAERVADKTGISPKTVTKFKNSSAFRDLNEAYRKTFTNTATA